MAANGYVSAIVCPECDGARRNAGVEGGPCLSCGGTGRLIFRRPPAWARPLVRLRAMTAADWLVVAIWAACAAGIYRFFSAK